MLDIHERLIYILEDFKKGYLNYAEAVSAIEAIYVRAIGGVPMSELHDVVDKHHNVKQ